MKAEIEAIEKHSEVYMAEAVAMLVQTVFDVWVIWDDFVLLEERRNDIEVFNSNGGRNDEETPVGPPEGEAPEAPAGRGDALMPDWRV